MDSSLITIIVSLVLSLLAGLGAKFVSSNLVETSVEEAKYSKRLKLLTKNLEDSSNEIDNIINELSKITVFRENRVKQLEGNLEVLQIKEEQLKEKISGLEKVPIPVAEYFAELTAQGEKKSAKRDYLLFGAGAVVSTAISITLKLIFGI